MVLCAGSFVARLVKSNFGLTVPVVPVKGYSMDIPTDVGNHKIHFGFKAPECVTTYIEPGYWRLAALGDLAGQDKSFDPRRVRYLKNSIATILDKDEVHQYKNLNTCLRPVPPDDKPIVGSMRLYPNVFLNAGHAGRGTTLGLSTSKIVAEQINEGKVSLVEDMQPFSPKRFWL